MPPGDDPDGLASLLSPLDGDPERRTGNGPGGYHERRIPMAPVKAIYERQCLTEELVRDLNPDATLKQPKNELRDIGYPT
ncbi:MAG: hypothetical protein KY475_00910 [Planctomycetes bacterium]|nr:hypothetical protein [Planctomycetota bacterium]